MAKSPKWTLGHIKFRKAAAAHKSLRKFFSEIGIECAAGSRIHRALQSPTIETATKIEKATGGRIKVKDWGRPANPPEMVAA